MAHVDRSLFAVTLARTPEERIEANSRAVDAHAELRAARATRRGAARPGLP